MPDLQQLYRVRSWPSLPCAARGPFDFGFGSRAALPDALTQRSLYPRSLTTCSATQLVGPGLANTDDKKPPASSVTRRRSQRDDVRAQIANAFYTMLEQLSADPDLLAVVGSWRDTLNDDEILEHLRSFNRGGKVLHKSQ
jgi:hypothetical protein